MGMLSVSAQAPQIQTRGWGNFEQPTSFTAIGNHLECSSDLLCEAVLVEFIRQLDKLEIVAE